MRKINLNIWLLVWVLLVVLAGQAAAGGTIHVPADFNNIQAAIDDANDDDIIVVAEGLYVGEGNRDIDFRGKAITVQSTNPYDTAVVAATVIDCEGTPSNLHRGFKFHSGEGPDSVLAGFTITNGCGPKEQVNGFNSDGGAIFCINSDPTITHCLITANSSISHNSNGGGGGIFCYRSKPIISNCTITNNSAEYGAGIYCYLSDATIRECMISGNSGRVGAGILCFNFRPVVKNCMIVNNSGQGFRCTGGYPLISHCYIANNTKEGISSNNAYANIDNCTIAGNSRGIYCNYRSPIISNCTITENSENGIHFEYCTPNFLNCILWNNGEAEIYSRWGSVSIVSYSNVEGGYPGQGNIDVDPLFFRLGYLDAVGALIEGDYHLQPTSPCIDAGDPNYLEEPNETDLDGNPRVIGGRIDMGAYEYTNTTPVACIVGGDRTIEATGPETRVTLDGSCSSDADSSPGTNDDIVSFDWYKVNASDPNFEDFIASGEIIDYNLPLAEHIIVLEVIDKTGAYDTNEVTIIIQDTTPSEFTLSVAPDTLWPVNHKMVLITPSWVASDICDESPEVSLVSITMNEEDEATSDGYTTLNIQIGDDGSIYLRAERSGDGSGRIYTITYQAVDDSGNVAVASATVTVPHDQR